MAIKLIGYLSLGYPTIEKSMERLEYYLEAGIDLIEVDLPTDNAFLDNEFIQARMKDALLDCNDYDFYLEAIKKIYDRIGNKLIVLSYKHTIRHIGIDKFVAMIKSINNPSLILVGDMSDTLAEDLMKQGLQIASWVPFILPENSVIEAKKSNGFVYLQAKSEGPVKEGYETLDKCVNYLIDQGIKRPIYCGVGVSTRKDIETIEATKAEAAFIGSALLKKEAKEDIINYIAELQGKI